MRPTPLLLLGLVSCSGGLSRDTIKNHPAINLRVLEPQVVDRSQPIEPSWVRQTERGAVDWMAFSGHGFGSDLDSARGNAVRDMLAAVASFISVEVESEFESVETSKNTGGAPDETQEVRNVVRARAGGKLEGIQPSGEYWEKVVASPLTPENVSFRAHVYARVSKDQIQRARVRKQAERQKASGRRSVVVLPFRPASGAAPSPQEAVLGQAFVEELSRRLADGPALHVGDAALIRSLLSSRPVVSEVEALDVLTDAMLPDWVVGGSYQLHEGQLRVTYTIRRGDDATVVRSRSVTRAFRELFELEEELVGLIRKDVKADEISQSPSPSPFGGSASASSGAGSAAPRAAAQSAAPSERERNGALAAFQAHHEAHALFSEGKNAAAVEKLQKAIALRPDYAEAYLRLGRILERMGRYGRVPRAHQERAATDWELKLCTDWSEISNEPREAFLAAGEGPPSGGAFRPSWDSTRAANVDHVLSAVSFVLQGGHFPELELPRDVPSAIAAYWRALEISSQPGPSKKPRLRSEALLALADLAVRVDRLAHAERIYRALYGQAALERDLHVMSLARYGLGIARRQQGRLEEAARFLEDALRYRTILGEKPYLLEIHNELGGVWVEAGRYPDAIVAFERARRLAEDLDQPYFLAVISNNLGVLETLRGRTAIADEHFHRAYALLQQVGESEGQLSSGLNLSHLGAAKGDIERAKRFLAETRRILEETSQEGRLAVHYNHRGYLSFSAGQNVVALRELLRSWALFHRLGRTRQDLRLRGNIAAAEYQHAIDQALARGVDPRPVLECLRDALAETVERGFGGAASAESGSGEAPNPTATLTRMNAAVLERVGASEE